MSSDSSRDLEKAATGLGDIIMRIVKRIENFWQRVTEGIAVQVLWSQFMAEARASYSLYTQEIDWEALRKESRIRRFRKTTSALFWAMLMKLSPARRVFLLIALFFAIVALTNSQMTISTNGHDHTYLFNPPNNFVPVLLAIAALIFLLALELADRVTMKRDLEIAREIQRWLVPESPPEVPGVDIAFVSRPANTVGGDYYDAFLRASPDPNSKRLLVVSGCGGKERSRGIAHGHVSSQPANSGRSKYIAPRAGGRFEPLRLRSQLGGPPVHNRIFRRIGSRDAHTLLRPGGTQRAPHTPRLGQHRAVGDRRPAAGRRPRGSFHLRNCHDGSPRPAGGLYRWID